MRERREQAIPPPLGDVETPPAFGRTSRRSLGGVLRDWEDWLIAFLGSFAEGLTPYSEYFLLRGNEFRVLRGLLKDQFVLDRPHGPLLEIGCDSAANPHSSLPSHVGSSGWTFLSRTKERGWPVSELCGRDASSRPTN